jgi:predicted unusual protein kinase regulating ubiquinone biosynthesis (AarF/ABC1/UbiB family)
LDWGQVKAMSDQILLNFSKMIIAINSKNQDEIIDAFFKLGVIVSNPNDKRTVECLAISMFDTKNIPGYIIDPFDENNALKSNSVTKLPPDIYFVLRTVQMFRGICFGLNLDYSLAEAWKPYAERAIKRIEK